MSSIRKPDYNLVHWPRPQDAAITRFLESLTQQNPIPSPLKESSLATHIADRLADHLAPYAQGNEDGLDSLRADVDQMATSFAAVASSPRIKMTFALIQDDMCRLFHTDVIELRLLCTYLGPGTLWVPDQYVNWEHMDKASNEARVHDLNEVRQLAPFELGILKGALYESNDGPAVLHRSPIVSKKDSMRVLLRFDSQLAW